MAVVFLLSMVVEFLTELVKDIVTSIQCKDWWTAGVKTVAIVLGVLVANVANSELLPLIGMTSFNSPGLVSVVGLIISAGSTKVYDLTKRLKDAK